MVHLFYMPNAAMNFCVCSLFVLSSEETVMVLLGTSFAIYEELF